MLTAVSGSSRLLHGIIELQSANDFLVGSPLKAGARTAATSASFLRNALSTQ
jgi:hypothetical protein